MVPSHLVNEMEPDYTNSLKEVTIGPMVCSRVNEMILELSNDYVSRNTIDPAPK